MRISELRQIIREELRLVERWGDYGVAAVGSDEPGDHLQVSVPAHVVSKHPQEIMKIATKYHGKRATTDGGGHPLHTADDNDSNQVRFDFVGPNNNESEKEGVVKEYDYDPPFRDPGEDYDYSELRFRDPGGKSALRAASRSNPRNQPCPTCGRPNRLTAKDVRLGYQCDDCADRDEGGGY